MFKKMLIISLSLMLIMSSITISHAKVRSYKTITYLQPNISSKNMNHMSFFNPNDRQIYTGESITLKRPKLLNNYDGSNDTFYKFLGWQDKKTNKMITNLSYSSIPKSGITLTPIYEDNFLSAGARTITEKKNGKYVKTQKFQVHICSCFDGPFLTEKEINGIKIKDSMKITYHYKSGKNKSFSLKNNIITLSNKECSKIGSISFKTVRKCTYINQGGKEVTKTIVGKESSPLCYACKEKEGTIYLISYAQ